MPHVDAANEAALGHAAGTQRATARPSRRWRSAAGRYASVDTALTLAAMVGFVAVLAASFGVEIAALDAGAWTGGATAAVRATLTCVSSATSAGAVSPLL